MAQSKVELAQKLIAQGRVSEARELLRQHYADRGNRGRFNGCSRCGKKLR